MKYLLTILISILVLQANAIDYTSNSNGTWTNSSIWDGGAGYPDDTGDNATINNGDQIELPNTGIKITLGHLHFNNNSKLTIPANDTLVCDSMVIWNNADLVVDGVLIVTGGVYMNNNSFLNVLLDGEIEVGGDFYGGNNADLNVDGTMTVDGEVDWNGDSPTGSGTVNGDPIGTLPIELIEFKAYDKGGKVIIEWSTASELNNNFFTIEKSNNGIDYKEVATINGSGTTSMLNEYTYADYTTITNEEVVYYRLKQTDYNGQSETFAPIAIKVNAIQQINNIIVASNTVETVFKSNIVGLAKISIINLCGQTVLQKEFNVNTGANKISLNINDKEKGLYLMRIDLGNSSTTQKFVY